MLGGLHDDEHQPALGQMPPEGEAGLAAADDDDVQLSIAVEELPAGSSRAGHRAAARSTVKLNIMPLCMCSAMWQ